VDGRAGGTESPSRQRLGGAGQRRLPAGCGLTGCGQTACCTSRMRCWEQSSRENRRFSSAQRPRMDFGHGLITGCGQTACCTSRMRCRERSSREKRRFSSAQRPRMDFGHGLIGTGPLCCAVFCNAPLGTGLCPAELGHASPMRGHGGEPLSPPTRGGAADDCTAIRGIAGVMACSETVAGSRAWGGVMG
jgi:hypothetical protein